jgi:phosphoribosylformylglycinamidine synthase PurS subunit
MEVHPMTARVFVSLKPTVLDPQGQTIRNALNAHGHPEVSEVRQGKFFDVALAGPLTADQARTVVETIARDVLANPVIENYRVELITE